MLILAGVALSSLTGENGLIKRTEQAKQKITEAEVKEKVELMLTDYQTAKSTNDELELVDYFEEKQKEKAIDSVTDNNNGTIIVGINGYDIIINKENAYIDRIQIANQDISTKLIENINNDSMLQEIFSSEESFTQIADNEQCCNLICEDSKLRNLIYDNYTITEPILASSETALNAMKNSSQYKVVGLTRTI